MGFLEQKTVLTSLKTLLKFSFCFVLLSCTQNPVAEIPYYNSPDFSPYFLSEKEAEKQITHQIPDFKFIDQNERTVSLASIKNKIHVANFFFTTCTDICPNMTSKMKLLEKAFYNDSLVKILSFSVTPWIDNSKKLLDYVNFYAIKTDNWHFLTGKKSEIYNLARKSYFAEEDFGFTKDSTEFLHTEHFILVDQNQKIRGIYNGTLSLEAEQLIKDIDALKKVL